MKKTSQSIERKVILLASIKVNGTKTISDLAAVTAINDADVFLIEVGGVTKKVTGATLKSLIAASAVNVDNTLSVSGDAADSKVVGDLAQSLEGKIYFNTATIGLVTDTYGIGGSYTIEDICEDEDGYHHGFKVLEPIFVKSVTVCPRRPEATESAIVKIIRYDQSTSKYVIFNTFEGVGNEPILISMWLQPGDGLLPIYDGNKVLGSFGTPEEFSTSYVFNEAEGTFEEDEWQYSLGSYIECVRLSDDVVSDVQVNGMSVVNDGVANVPIATTNTYGIMKVVNHSHGLQLFSDGEVGISTPTTGQLKEGAVSTRTISPKNQHESTFYGLAKAAGADEKNSALSMGVYSDNAKSAIKAMLGVGGETQTVSVSGTTPVIVANQNTRYVCGEVTSLDFTPSTAGICDVIFTSGSTVAVLTIPNTVVFPSWFDSTSLEANTTYEISISDSIYGAVMIW